MSLHSDETKRRSGPIWRRLSSQEHGAIKIAISTFSSSSMKGYTRWRSYGNRRNSGIDKKMQKFRPRYGLAGRLEMYCCVFVKPTKQTNKNPLHTQENWKGREDLVATLSQLAFPIRKRRQRVVHYKLPPPQKKKKNRSTIPNSRLISVVSG